MGSINTDIDECRIHFSPIMLKFIKEMQFIHLIIMENIEMFFRTFFYLRTAVLVVIFMVLTGTISPIMAANYAGVYMGGFLGTADNGSFAVLVREDNSAVIMAYDSIDDFGFINENVTISSDGTFSENNIDGFGTNIAGTVTSTGISGTIDGLCS